MPAKSASYPRRGRRTGPLRPHSPASVPPAARAPHALTSITSQPTLLPKGIAVIVRKYPSTLVWPLLVLGVVLGLGAWGVTAVDRAVRSSLKDRATNVAIDTAVWYKQQLTSASAPVMLMSAMVKYDPQYESVQRLFNGLAPALLAMTSKNVTKQIEYVPNGVVRDIYPLVGNNGDAAGFDLFASDNLEGAVRTLEDGRLTLVGPMDFVEGGYGVIVRDPIFVPVPDPSVPNPWGLPDDVDPACGAPCGYNATTGMRFWGFSAGLIDLDAISRAADAKPHMLASLGYRYEIRALGITQEGMRVVAASEKLPKNPVEAIIQLPNSQWVVAVSPEGGWSTSYYGGLLAGMIFLALAVSVLLFLALVSRRRHQMLLQALLPKDVIRDLHMSAAQSLMGPRVLHAETTSDMMLNLLGQLLEGGLPDLRDVVYIRQAIIRSADIYQPIALNAHFRNANLDRDVARALMRQLGHGLGSGAAGGGDEDEDLEPRAVGQWHRSPTGATELTQDEDVCTLPGALKVILTPKPALWCDALERSATDPALEPALPGREGEAEAVLATERVSRPSAMIRAIPYLHAAAAAAVGRVARVARLSHAGSSAPEPGGSRAGAEEAGDELSVGRASGAGAAGGREPARRGSLAGSGHSGPAGFIACISGTACGRPSTKRPGSRLVFPAKSTNGSAGVPMPGTPTSTATSAATTAGGAVVAAVGSGAMLCSPGPKSVRGSLEHLSSGEAGAAGAPPEVVLTLAPAGPSMPLGALTGADTYVPLTGGGGDAGGAGGGVGGPGGAPTRGSAAAPGGGSGVAVAVQAVAASPPPQSGGALGQGGQAPMSAPVVPLYGSVRLELEGRGDAARSGDQGPHGQCQGPLQQQQQQQPAFRPYLPQARATRAGTLARSELPHAQSPSQQHSHAPPPQHAAAATPRCALRTMEHAASSRCSALNKGHALPSLDLEHAEEESGPHAGGAAAAGGAHAVHSTDGAAVSPAVVGTPGREGRVVVLAMQERRASHSQGDASLGTVVSRAQCMPPPRAVVEEVERVLAGADAWHFDTWRLHDVTGGFPLSALGFYLIHRAGLTTTFKLRPSVLARWLRHIEAGYRNNPYHNATHAADVLQTFHVIIHGAQLHVHYLDPLGLLAAYFAAIVHDYGHPGLTNDFLVATADPLAVRYNDRSPLENHHVAAAFSAMRRPGMELLAPLSGEQVAVFRKQVIDMVLGTDMKQHFALLSQFNNAHRLATFVHGQAGGHKAEVAVSTAGTADKHSTMGGGPEVGGRDAGAGSATYGRMPAPALHEVVVGPSGAELELQQAPKPIDETERALALQVALKCADIGHLGEALDVHKRWLVALEEEFFRQGDRERELGLPISPLFDRSKQGTSKSQVGFYDFVALPLVHALSSAFTGAQPLMRHFLATYSYWKAVDDKAAGGATPLAPSINSELPSVSRPRTLHDLLSGRSGTNQAAPAERRA